MATQVLPWGQPGSLTLSFCLLSTWLQRQPVLRKQLIVQDILCSSQTWIPSPCCSTMLVTDIMLAIRSLERVFAEGSRCEGLPGWGYKGIGTEAKIQGRWEKSDMDQYSRRGDSKETQGTYWKVLEKITVLVIRYWWLASLQIWDRKDRKHIQFSLYIQFVDNLKLERFYIKMEISSFSGNMRKPGNITSIFLQNSWTTDAHKGGPALATVSRTSYCSVPGLVSLIDGHCPICALGHSLTSHPSYDNGSQKPNLKPRFVSFILNNHNQSNPPFIPDPRLSWVCISRLWLSLLNARLPYASSSLLYKQNVGFWFYRLTE